MTVVGHGAGSVGRRLLIGAGVIIVLLVSALAATTLSAAREEGPRRELRETVDLVAATGQLRALVGQLGNAQAVVALDVVRDRPDAMTDANPHRADVARLLERARHQLAVIDDDATTAEERARVGDVVTVLDAFSLFDQGVAADYSSTNAALHQRARSAILNAQVERYSDLADAVVELDSVVNTRSIRLAQDIADADRRARHLHVAITAVLIASVVAVAVWMAQANRERRRLVDRLRLEAERDPLTGVANRRRWERCLADALQEARRHGAPLSAVLVDLDHFKRFNDTFGHLAGDEHLREVSHALAELVGSRDRVARLGGEEFAMVLPDHTPVQAAFLIEQLRPRIPQGQTFSAGIAGWEAPEAALELMARADLALYRAKEHGRNRVAIAA